MAELVLTLQSYHKEGSIWKKNMEIARDKDGQIIYGEDKKPKMIPAPPLVNDLFIYEVVLPQCKPYISRNLINSNFTEKRILGMLRCTCNDIANAMADGWDRYGIRFENYDLVDRAIKNTIIPGPFRAQNGWTKKTDSTVTRRIENLNENPAMQEKKKLFGLI